MATFRVTATALVITLPCNDLVARDAYFQFLQTKFPDADIVVGFEESDKETPYKHLHSSIRRRGKDSNGKTKRITLLSANALDFAGKHPNIQPARSYKKWTEYTCKDGKTVENFDTKPYFKGNFKGLKRKRDPSRSTVLWGEICDELKKGKMLMELYLALSSEDQNIFGKDLLPKAQKFEKWIVASRRPKKRRKIYQFSNQTQDPNLLKFPKFKTAKSMVLTGLPGSGKTTWARYQFKNPLIVRHLDKLKQYNARVHDGIIFDDMNFSMMEREPKIHLLDVELDTDINVKHGMVTIPAETPRIFVTNLTLQAMLGEHDAAHDRRIVLVSIAQLLNAQLPLVSFTQPDKTF